jgi:uncharacterized protein YndB with AHSA1/START domain
LFTLSGMTVPSLRGYAAFVEMSAQPAELWRWLTEPALLLRWYAATVQLDCHPPGRLVARFADGRTVHARVMHHDPLRRLSFAFDPAPDWPGTAVISEDWIIDARPDKVVLRVLGEGVPALPAWAPWWRRQQSRWAVSLSQLKQAQSAARLA